MASHGITDSISQLFGDGLACLLKRRLDKRNLMFLGYLLHENHLTGNDRTDFLELLKILEHHVALASHKGSKRSTAAAAKRNAASCPPCSYILREISTIAETHQCTHDDLDALPPCQNLRQLENRHLVTLLWHKLHVESDKIRYLVVHDNLRNDTCQELLGILYPTFH